MHWSDFSRLNPPDALLQDTQNMVNVLLAASDRAMLAAAEECAEGRLEEITVQFKIKGERLVVLLAPALVLAAPAFAEVRNTTLSDATEPGSVIVFPKFTNAPAVTLLESTREVTVTAPVTELEIGVVCPQDVTCTEHQPVKIRFHWVCGTTEADLAGSFVCRETEFDVTATVWEKIVLVPDGTPQNGYAVGLPTKTVPKAPCIGGYLIGWVINAANDEPIKFDGLVGNAIVRPGSRHSGSPTAQAGYDAVPIQADPALANGAAITTNANGALLFDGGAGHYQAVTGQVIGDVRYANLTIGPTFSRGFLTLLTLDVKSNRPNNPVFVDLDFFGGNPSVIGNENQLSTGTEFICWAEVPIDSIDPNLTIALMGRKGMVVSAAAQKFGIFGIADETGPTTLLGVSETLDGGVFPPTAAWPRASFSRLFNSSVPAPTHFLPLPSPNFLP
jgi:hypothetical protein